MNQTWKIIISVIITAGIVGGGVYYWQNSKTPLQTAITDEVNNNKEDLSVVDLSTEEPKNEVLVKNEKSINETASWKAHSSMGVSIKYPNDGSYTIESYNNGFTITQAHPGTRVHVRQDNDSSVLSEEFTTKVINGKTFIEAHSEGEGNGYGYTIEHDGRFYHFTSVWGPTNEVFELMMTTVEFE